MSGEQLRAEEGKAGKGPQFGLWHVSLSVGSQILQGLGSEHVSSCRYVSILGNTVQEFEKRPFSSHAVVSRVDMFCVLRPSVGEVEL